MRLCVFDCAVLCVCVSRSLFRVVLTGWGSSQPSGRRSEHLSLRGTVSSVGRVRGERVRKRDCWGRWLD